MSLTAKYLGDHKVECVHSSGGSIITRAPGKDGTETTFTPTDLCAASLANCALTIMSFLADRHNIDMTGTTCEIKKEMTADSSRIAKIEIVFNMPEREYSEKDKTILERAAEKCPIHKSLSPEIEQVFTYRWPV